MIIKFIDSENFPPLDSFITLHANRLPFPYNLKMFFDLLRKDYNFHYTLNHYLLHFSEKIS